MESIISRIFSLNTDRADQNIFRRLSKLYEEFGELNQAILNLTSRKNPKNKTINDVVEEFVDVSIMALDIAATFESESEVIKIYNIMASDMENTVIDSDDKMNNAFEALSLMAREIGILANYIHSDSSEKVFSCIVTIAMHCSRKYMDFDFDEIKVIFSEKLDKWERNTKLKLDLCPTPDVDPELIDKLDVILTKVQESAKEHGWKPYNSDPNF